MPIKHTPTQLNALRAKVTAVISNAHTQAEYADNPTLKDIRLDPRVADFLHLAPENIFRHLDRLRIPAVAYVAGAGPGLLEELDSLPPNAYVVACNRAILAKYPYRLWMVFDKNAPKYPWFKNPPPGDYERIYGNALRKLYPGTLWFSSRRTPQPYTIAPGGIQGGGTIVCCALQLLYWAGVKTAYLLGSPMRGRFHFDGSQAAESPGIWKQASRARFYIYQMAQGGMSTVALSENSMDIPIVEPPR